MSTKQLTITLNLDSGKFTSGAKSAASSVSTLNIELNQSDKAIKQLASDMGSLASEINQLNARLASGRTSIKNFGAAAKSAHKDTDDFGHKLKGLTIALVVSREAFENAHFWFIRWAQAMVMNSSELERRTILLKNLSTATSELGKQREAADQMEFLFKQAQKVPYSIDAISDSFAKIRVTGVNVEKAKVWVDSLTRAAAAAGASDEQLKRAGVAIQQMVGKGVVSLEELRQQLGEALPTAMQAMAEGTGLSMSELTKAISQGTVKAEPAIDRMMAVLNNKAGDAAAEMMKTLTGQLSVLKTSFIQVSNSFTGFTTKGAQDMNSLYSVIVNTFGELNSWLQSPPANAFFSSLGKDVRDMIIGVKDLINNLVQLNQTFPILQTLITLLKTLAVVIGVNLAASAMKSLITSFIVFRTNLVGIFGAVQNFIALMQILTSAIVMQGNAAVSAAVKSSELKAAFALLGSEAALVAGGIGVIVAALVGLGWWLSQSSARAKKLEEDLKKMAATRAAVARGEVMSDKEKKDEENRLKNLEHNKKVALQANQSTQYKGETFENAQKRIAYLKDLDNKIKESKDALNKNQENLKNNEARAIVDSSIAKIQRNSLLTNERKQQLIKQAIEDGYKIGLQRGASRDRLDYIFEGARANLNQNNTVDGLGTDKDLYTASKNANGKSGKAKVDEAAKDAQALAEKIQNAYQTAMSSAEQSIVGVTDNILDQESAYDKMLAKLKNDKFLSKLADNDPRRKALLEESKTLDNLNKKYEDVKVFKKVLNDTEDAKAGVNSLTNSILSLVNSSNKSIGSDLIKEMSKYNSPDTLAKIKSGEKFYYSIKNGADAASLAMKDMAENGDDVAKTQVKIADTGEQIVVVTAKLKNAARRDILGDLNYYKTLESQLKSLYDSLANINDLKNSYNKDGAMLNAVISNGGRALNDYQKSLFDTNVELEKISKNFNDIIKNGNPEAIALKIKNLTENKNKQEADITALNSRNKELTILLQKGKLSEDELKKIQDEISLNNSNIQLSKENLDNINKTIDGYNKQSEALKEIIDNKEAILNNTKEGLAVENSRKVQSIITDELIRQSQYYDNMKVKAFSLKDIGWAMLGVNKQLSPELERQSKYLKEIFDLEIARLDAEIKRKQSAGEDTLALEKQRDAIKAAKGNIDKTIENDSPMKQMAESWSNMTKNMQDASSGWINSFVDGITSGKMSFKDFAKSILKDIAAIIIKAIIANAILTALGMGGNTASVPNANAIGAELNTAATANPGIFHNGGMVGLNSPTFSRKVAASIFTNAQKYHTGGIAGLKKDEVPAILQTGERVLNREETKKYGKNDSTNVQVNVINNSGTPLTSKTSDTKFDGRQYVIDVVVDSLSKPGKMRDAMNGFKNS